MFQSTRSDSEFLVISQTCFYSPGYFNIPVEQSIRSFHMTLSRDFSDKRYDWSLTKIYSYWLRYSSVQKWKFWIQKKVTDHCCCHYFLLNSYCAISNMSTIHWKLMWPKKEKIIKSKRSNGWFKLFPDSGDYFTLMIFVKSSISSILGSRPQTKKLLRIRIPRKFKTHQIWSYLKKLWILS